MGAMPDAHDAQHPASDAGEPRAWEPPAWLEDLEGERARAWVEQRNAETLAALGGEELTGLAHDLEALLDNPDRIPAVGARHGMLYNFWLDAEHPRGIWRRTTWESYVLGAPGRADRRPETTDWELLLDLDALAEETGLALTWAGAQVLTRGPDAGRRALVTLAIGGSDTNVTREYDLVERRFLEESEDGFRRLPGKGAMSWADDDGASVLLSGELGAGSLSAPGYPRQVRRLRRWQGASEGEALVTAGADAVAAFAARDPWGRTWLTTMPSFAETRIWLLPDDAACPSGEAADALLADGDEHVPAGAIRLDVPGSSAAGVGREWVTIELREPWEVDGAAYRPGTLLAAPLGPFLEGRRELTVLFEPSCSSFLSSAAWTRNHLVLTVLDDVVQRLEVCTPPASGHGEWGHHWVDLTGAADLPGLPEPDATELRPGRALLAVTASAVDARDTDYLWVSASGWTTPSTLTVGRLTEEGELFGMSVVRQAPARYDATGVRVSQHVARSADGTAVPYLEIGRPSSAPVPALVEAYGAFGRSLTPGYEPVIGRAWLERGGVFVVVNTRGGGEYGPAWHRAAIGPGRHRVVEDLEAVAESLLARGVTTPEMLGLHGSSAGGIAVGGLMARRPELVGAVALEVPLLDLERYAGLLAGASWRAELGDPADPEQWAWLRTLSPLHLLEEGVTYPPTLLVTSTRDDRVHPWHARAFAHRLGELGQDVSYWESAEGGHGGSTTNSQRARVYALVHEFLWRRTRGAAG